MKLFIVEDDQVLKKELMTFLTNYGYNCESSDNFGGIVTEIIEAQPDLILLDINLPLVDGYHLCTEIRKVSSIPLIVVTSRDTEMDELMSMNLGADDFVTKPYNSRVLLARIQAVLKRSEKGSENLELSYKGLCLSVSTSKATSFGKEVELTKNELQILLCLMRNKEKIISRNELMNELWQSDEFVDDNTLTVNVNRLRKKLEEVGMIDFIKTKRGQGYSL